MRTAASKKVRRWIASLFPGRFPGLYSTLDHPIVVPVQEAAYRLCVEKYLYTGDRILDVGFGLGYGLKMMATRADRLVGIDIDRKAVSRGQALVQEIPAIREIQAYDGEHIPFTDGEFDLVTCVDVIEHVPDYGNLLREMVRVARRMVLLSTPNRLPENTLPNGRPRNRWHLREWNFEEFDDLLNQIPGIRVEWNFLDGPWAGPFQVRSAVSRDTLALTPALFVEI